VEAAGANASRRPAAASARIPRWAPLDPAIAHASGARAGSGLADAMHCLAGRVRPLWREQCPGQPGEQDVEAAPGFGGAGGGRYGDRGYFVEPIVLTNTGPLGDTATIALVISPMVRSGYRSGPRWLMAFAACDVAETLGAFDAGIG
jgi:hypothetical protein